MDLGTFWNGVFEVLWIIAQLAWWVGVVVGAVILAFAIIVGCFRGVKSWFKPKTASYRKVMDSAEVEAFTRNPYDQSFRKGFVDGAQWHHLNHN